MKPQMQPFKRGPGLPAGRLRRDGLRALALFDTCIYLEDQVDFVVR